MELREVWESIRTLGLRRFIYLRFFYRSHMRRLHARGKHKMTHYGPMLPDGGSFDRCDWCGHMENIVPAETPLLKAIRSGKRPEQRSGY